MNKNIKLSTAIRMLKVATNAVNFEYANAKGGDNYAQGSKLSQALYRADQLRRIIDNTSRELGLT